jgi:hypothetical protein
MSPDDTEDAIARQLSKIEEAVTWSAQGQLEAAKLWRLVNLCVGVPAAFLAAVAGVTALASTTSRIAAGIISLIAAGLAAVAATLDAAKRAQAAQSAGNKYLALQQDTAIARDVDLPVQELGQARKTLHDLADRRQVVNADAPVIPRIGYRRARRNIEVEGGQDYKADHAE